LQHYCQKKQGYLRCDSKKYEGYCNDILVTESGILQQHTWEAVLVKRYFKNNGAIYRSIAYELNNSYMKAFDDTILPLITANINVVVSLKYARLK
jgi:hypothetical protein